MSFNKRIKIKKLLENDHIGQDATIMGWVRTKRSNKNVTFIAINDGSTINNYQAVADPALIDEALFLKANNTESYLLLNSVTSVNLEKYSLN